MKNFTIELGPDQQEGGRVRRLAYSPESLVQIPAPGVHTLYDVLVSSAKKYGKKNGFGSRNIDNIIDEESYVTVNVKGINVQRKEKKKYLKLSKFYYINYEDALELVHHAGAGLVKLGIKEKSKIVFYSSTNIDWMLTAHSCFSQNMIIVTTFDALGVSALFRSLHETEAVAVYTTEKSLEKVCTVVSRCPHLKYIIYTGQVESGIASKLRRTVSQEIVSLEAIGVLGKKNPVEPKRPESEDLCCIMYTSGSTDVPKGVMLSHKNIVAAIAGAHSILGHLITDQDSMLAYLPLAHVFEFVVENLCIFWGVSLGYGSTRTLVDSSVRRCQGDIKEFRPTLMTGTPLFWELIRKDMLAKLSRASPGAQAAFQRALYTKSWLLERHMPTNLIDKLVFSKYKKILGGSIRFGLSGGAALSTETQKFLSVALCPILTGFGMTESSGMGCIMTPEQFGFGHVGSLVPCCEIKLVNVHANNYFSTNFKQQGEVWIRGPSVTRGYWKREDLTREALTEDNWFRTGDVAEWNDDGTLTVIDRIRNFVKLSNGEYVALEKLELIYRECIYVDYVCIYVDSRAYKPVALAALTQLAVRRLAIENDVVETEWKYLCENKIIKEAIFDDLLAQAKKAGLCNHETIFDVHMCPELWTAETKMLTATGKLRRIEILKAYKNELNDM